MVNAVTPQFLYEQYVVQQHSLSEVGRQCGLSVGGTAYWMRKWGIPRRTLSRANHLASRNDLTITPRLRELLEGELLGDGCIAWLSSGLSARYSHSSKYEQYLEWLSAEFAREGLNQSGAIRKYTYKTSICGGPVREYTSYKYKTIATPALGEFMRRFYPVCAKVVPPDINLTPITLRQWYIGDGYLGHRKGGRRPFITFCTEGFDNESVTILAQKLHGIGFKCSLRRRRDRYNIRLSSKVVKDFLDYIGPCPIECYAYKWDYEGKLKVRE